MLRGLDVSSVQGKVDWPSVAGLGCRFVFAKCSEGNKGHDPIFNTPSFLVDRRRAAGVSGRDPRFNENVDGARTAGLFAGAYHFAYPLPHQDGNPLRDPDKQAKFAFDCAAGLGSLSGELPPMLDLEWPPPEQWGKWGCSAEQIRAWAHDYLDSAKGYWGCAPVLYTYPYFWTALQAREDTYFQDFPLCMASYPHPPKWPNEGESPPALVLPWKTWAFWQFTGGQMKLPNGVDSDFDVFNGDEAALVDFCDGASSPAPPALAMR
jgi:lysozyme